MLTPGTVWHSIYRGVMVFVIMGFTTAMAGNPQWGDVTLGSLIVAVLHYLEKQVTTS